MACNCKYLGSHRIMRREMDRRLDVPIPWSRSPRSRCSSFIVRTRRYTLPLTAVQSSSANKRRYTQSNRIDQRPRKRTFSNEIICVGACSKKFIEVSVDKICCHSSGCFALDTWLGAGQQYVWREQLSYYALHEAVDRKSQYSATCQRASKREQETQIKETANCYNTSVPGKGQPGWRHVLLLDGGLTGCTCSL